jgi:hypothetical protein
MAQSEGRLVRDRAIWGRAVAVWLLIIVFESVHGMVRSVWLAPIVGDFEARQIGVVTGSILILAVTWASFGWLRPGSRKVLVAIGVLWAILTALFEITLGRYVFGAPWSRLLADYDLPHGGLMGLGLLLMASAPLIAHGFLTRRGFAL